MIVRFNKGDPVQLECTMPNGTTQLLSYDQWQTSAATWTGCIIAHRSQASTLLEVLKQIDTEGEAL